MKTKLFVGNLSYDAKDEELRKLFEPYGPIESVTVVVDRKSGRSKGYGFVQMVDTTDAAKALEISGREFMGRDLIVTEAESSGEGSDRPRRGGRPGGRHSSRPMRPRREGHSSPAYAKNGKGTVKQSWWKKLLGVFTPGAKKPEASHEPRTSGHDRPGNFRPRRRYRGGSRRGSGGPRGSSHRSHGGGDGGQRPRSNTSYNT